MSSDDDYMPCSQSVEPAKPVLVEKEESPAASTSKSLESASVGEVSSTSTSKTHTIKVNVVVGACNKENVTKKKRKHAPVVSWVKRHKESDEEEG